MAKELQGADFDQNKIRNFATESTKQTAFYSIGFAWMREKPKNSPQESKGGLAGSGTLVRIGDISGILTADHVIEELIKIGTVGLILPSSLEQYHRIALTMDTVETVRFRRGADEAMGPDIGLVVLPATLVATLGAIQSFYNLPKHCERILSLANKNDGPWILAGWPNEWVSAGAPVKGYDVTYQFPGFGGIGTVLNEVERKEFDFLTFGIDYGTEGYDGPTDFRGLSGGGLWQGIGLEDDGQEIQVEEWLLSGIAFYQSNVESGKRTIICHGRQSIYLRLIDELGKQA